MPQPGTHCVPTSASPRGEDLHAVRIEVARLLGAMLAHEPDNFWEVLHWWLSAHDNEGLLLFELQAMATEAQAAHSGSTGKRVEE